MTPDELATFATVTDPQLHPDGLRVAFVVSRMNFDDNRYDRSIWLWDGAATKPFTHGPVDSRPRWSPSGDRLVFLRASGEKGSSAQVALISVDGGEAEVITEFGAGAGEVEWSPDGSHLAVLATEWADDWKDLDDDARSAKPRRIVAPEWRFDNIGSLHNKGTHIYLVDLQERGSPIALTSGTRPDSNLAWRPDGSAIGFLSGRHDSAGFDGENQAWEVPADGGDPVAIVQTGSWSGFWYRPDGVAHVVGLANFSDYPASDGLFRIERGQPVRLAPDFDRSVVSPGSGGPQWLDNGSCRVVAEDRGSVVVVEIAPDDSWRELVDGRREVTGMVSRSDGSAMAFTTSGVTDPGELAWFENGEERTLTGINAEFRAEAELVDAEHLVVDSDGVELGVWVFLPPGDESVPVLFNIHGGPAAQYGWTFHDEFQVYVAAGFGVVATNPRGASGRGDEFMRGALRRWDEERPPDIDDLLAALDGSLAQVDRLDADRVGIMGGSYGGLITAKILAIDHRFKSAVAERGLYNFMSFAGHLTSA